MSNDNTLDDLILTDPEPEKAKSKGLLALLALVILLIIVGAILAKMIFSDPQEPKKAKSNEKVEVATDVNSNLDKVTANNESADKNSDLAPITDEPDLAPIGNDMPANIETVNVDEDKPAKGNAKADTKVESKGTANKDGVEVTTNNTTNSNKTESELKGDSTNVANSEDSLGVAPVGASSAKAKQSSTVREESTRRSAPARHTTSNTRAKRGLIGGRGNVYIQVGSFTKGPESSFIRKIRNAGFKYRIKTQNGHRRVYVGPFESRSEASKYLGRVKSRINSQAFIK
jgi:cell division protein FtsN